MEGASAVRQDDEVAVYQSIQRRADSRISQRRQSAEVVVIGKWLATNPQVLILDEPTRGVDIGAKKEIYDLMNKLAADESRSDDFLKLPEVLGMSDRILVMHEGKITGQFSKEEATQEKIMICATGGGEPHAS